MRTVAICGTALPDLNPSNTSFGRTTLLGQDILHGVLEIPQPDFDGSAPRLERAVLLRVRAFSCNYRDRGAMLRTVARMAPDAALSIGSEFVADVVAVGLGVTTLAIGDRVVGDNAYPDVFPTDRSPGIPTNHASREYLVLPESTVIRIPPEMTDEVAAAFSLGAQTSYSMVRKLGITEGSKVLVTAASSNTSLFAIQAARNRGAQVFATTTSDRVIPRLLEMGVQEVFVVNPDGGTFAQDAAMEGFTRPSMGFDYVIDPFADVYLPKALSVMARGGRYATCGFMNQSMSAHGVHVPGAAASAGDMLIEAISRNVHVIANCLGLRDDLAAAVEDYREGRFEVFVDSVYRDGQVGPFLQRTYEAADRFGKVVYAYA